MISAVNAAVSRSRTVLVAYLVLVIAGILSYVNMPKEFEPDIELPFITVSMTLEGASPLDSERLLVRPMEQELRTLPGLREMVSSAREGRATITLELDPTIDVMIALQDVRDRVATGKAKLPADAEEPRVNEIRFSRFDPMMVLNIGGRAPERTLAAIARDLRERIENVPGVLEVDLVGVREEQLEIIVDPLLMESMGLSPVDVLAFVERNNRLIAAGSLEAEQGRFPVKVPGIIESPDDVLNMPIKTDGQTVVLFRDVASVRRNFRDADSFARLNGEPALTLEVINSSGANVLATSDQVKQVVAEAQQFWPPGIQLNYSRDKSIFIRSNISNLVDSVGTAIVLVVISLIAILGIRSAILVGLAIPGSMVAAFLFLDLGGLTINMVVLFGLIMSVGLLVDGSIVVTELADRKMAEGLPRADAYREAAQRMAWPVITATVTTLAAFLPLLFWPGLTGNFLFFLPLTLMATLTASLLMALMFVPALGSMIGSAAHHNEKAMRTLAVCENGDLNEATGLTGAYVRIMGWCVDNPVKVVAAFFTVLVGIYALYGQLHRGIGLFPEIDPVQGSVDIRAMGDLSAVERDRLVRQVEDRIFEIPGIRDMYVRSGAVQAGAPPDQIGSVRLNFADWRVRPTANEIMREVRRATADIAGLQIEARLPEEGPVQGKPIIIEVSGISLDAIQEGVEVVRAELERVPGALNVEDTRPLPGIEWLLRVDRAEAAKFGADIALVGNIVQLVTNGIKLGEFRPDDADDELDIRVRFPAEQRSLDRLAELRIPTAQGNVPIGTFVTREAADAMPTIVRTDGRRTMLVQADLERGVPLGTVLSEFSRRMGDVELPPGVQLRFKGSAQEEADTVAFLGRAFLIALGLIAMILLAQFNSIYQALLILTAIIFATGGVLLGLMVSMKPFVLMACGIGIIALAGIVVNNNIVLIDTYNNLRASGMAVREAIMRTGAQRLRPVLLTTGTTVLGLFPMAIALNIDFAARDMYFGGPGTAWWELMAAVISGGLIFATALTLLMTPCMLMIQENVSAWWHARGRRTGREAEAT
ncbi:MAG: efflux RND transporter permease subunit [Chromatiales bacterium]|nr:efflux RND transporter permease subunit [Chromatiales bacterium]